MERISGTAFMSPGEVSGQQSVDLDDCMSAATAFWLSAQADPSWKEEHLRPHGRCIYASLALCDILHGTGRTDAQPVRTGLDVRGYYNDQLYILTVGDPETPMLPRKINAHVVVRLGNIIVDPAFAQTRRWWNNLPHYAAFRVGAPEGETIGLNGGCDARTTTVRRWFEGDDAYQVSYFRLPRNVDLATRQWRAAPDALPERRMSVVKRAIEIRLADMAATSERAA